MREVQPDGPYFLGGYSFGGSVALEMAQQLRAAGQAVDFVGIFDHIPANAPGKRNRLTPGGLATLTGNVPCWIWDDLLHTPPGRMAVRARGVAWGFVRHFFGNKESADNQINLARWFGVSNLPENEHRRFQSNYEAGRKYRPKPYAGRVTIFRSRAMPLLKLRDIVRRWRLLADDVDAVIIPGSHGTMFTHPHVLRALIERLRNRLDQAENKR